MDLDYDLYWCAVKDVTTEAIPRVYGPNTGLRPAGPDETIRGTNACFTKGAWTFFLSPRDIFKVETMFPDREVVQLCCDATNSWSSVAHFTSGAVDWSVYGAMEDDCVRSTGEVPPAAVRFTDATENCEAAPILVAHAITGFRHDKAPRKIQIVEAQPPRALILPTRTIQQPSLSQLEAAIADYLATPGASLKLVIDDKAMMASYANGEIHLENHQRRIPHPRNPRPLDGQDVRRCFADFFDAGKLSSTYNWWSE